MTGITFLDASHGYVQVKTLSHPDIYETFDAGKTWAHIGNGVPGFRTGRSFATTSTGWSIDERSKDDDWNAWTGDTVHVTHDGGNTWKVCLKTGHRGDFVFGGIQALSVNEAWVVGISGTYQTLDGGVSWHKSGPPGTGIQFLDPQHGWLLDDNLLFTNDGGKNWQIIAKDPKSCFGGLGFFFLNGQRAWAVGGESAGHTDSGSQTGYVTTTFDAGRTCKQMPSIPNQIFHSVFFLSEKQGWIGGIGALLRTDDGGITWLDTSTGAQVETRIE